MFISFFLSSPIVEHHNTSFDLHYVFVSLSLPRHLESVWDCSALVFSYYAPPTPPWSSSTVRFFLAVCPI